MMANLLAFLGMLAAVAVQVFFLGYFRLDSIVDGIIAGPVVGACIVAGFKLGKGVSEKAFPVYLVALAVVAVVLGFSFGTSLWIYDYGAGAWTFGDSMGYFLDLVFFEGIIIDGEEYISMILIDMAIAIGIAVLIIGGKKYVQQSMKQGEDYVSPETDNKNGL